MEWLNYHHLLYFWAVAREGSVTRASQQLRLAQPTVSGQLKALEDALGEKLFERTGRRLRAHRRGARRVPLRRRDLLPRAGAAGHAQGAADGAAASASRSGWPTRFPSSSRTACSCPRSPSRSRSTSSAATDKPERLLAELSVHALDLVLSDAPVGAEVKVKAYSHLLGETPVAFFGTEALASAHRKGFPRSLDGAPRPPAHRGQLAAPLARPVVRRGGPPPPRRGRDRGQRAPQGLRPGRGRPLRRPGRHRGGGPGAVRGEAAWAGWTRSRSASTPSPRSGSSSTRRWSRSPRRRAGSSSASGC